MKLKSLVVALLCSMAACAGLGEEAPTSNDEGKDLYEATAIVLEDGRHGPMLCLGIIATSDPPQCGDVAIDNWDWKVVENEKRAAETIWGNYYVVGQFDGRSFTVTEVGKPERTQDTGIGDPIDTPCPEPEGRWRAVDPSKVYEGAMQAAMRIAQSAPDFAGVWIDYIDETAAEEGAYANPDTDPELIEEGLGPDNIILNAAFTGDIDRHEAEMRQRWGGALCVVQRPRTEEELMHIQRDLEDAAEDLNLQIISTSTHVVDNVVDLEVVVLTEEAREALDARYGEGAVRSTGVLQPVR